MSRPLKGTGKQGGESDGLGVSAGLLSLDGRAFGPCGDTRGPQAPGADGEEIVAGVAGDGVDFSEPVRLVILPSAFEPNSFSA